MKPRLVPKASPLWALFGQRALSFRVFSGFTVLGLVFDVGGFWLEEEDFGDCRLGVWCHGLGCAVRDEVR